MFRLRKKRREKAHPTHRSAETHGLRESDPVLITLMDYDAGQYQEKVLTNIQDAFQFKDTSSVTWINIDGVHQTDIVGAVGQHFNLHPLLIEDIVIAGQRPKCEDFDHHLFVLVKMLRYDDKHHTVLFEQISLIIGVNYVISFQETIGDVFDGVRERIRSGKGRIRRMGTDYLAYALIDAIVDNYFVVLEQIGERVEDLEEAIINNPNEHIPGQIHRLKREIAILRKSIWPMREVVAALQRSENDLMTESTEIFLRDVYDHAIQAVDTMEVYRDMVSGIMDLYLSSLSHKMNSVMKVLTTIATVFMPLSFITGVYGMNFAHFPELQAWWMYPLGFWGIIAAVGLSMLFFFKRQKWM